MNTLWVYHSWVVFVLAVLFLACVISELVIPDDDKPPMWRKPRGFFSVLVWILWWEVTLVFVVVSALIYNRWDYWNDEMWKISHPHK